MSVLSVRGLSVNYSGVLALAGVDLDIHAGQFVGLIGPNGAGKTTFIDAVCGFTRCRGEIRFDGFDITGAPPHRRARLGLARTWQTGELFDDLTVTENLAVTAQRRGWWSTIAETLGRPAARSPRIADTLDVLDLGGFADTGADKLTQSQRKLVGVARALAGAPQLMCLDEPAAGLDSEESRYLGKHLRAIADAGTALLLVDHDMGLVMGVCDHVVVLDFGKVIAAGPPEQVRADPAVMAAYLGAGR
jgi:branched-chain amino acid transport system ATP-binding protein